MYVRSLIGRDAGTIINLPYHAASSGLQFGTCAPVTDEEVLAVGMQPESPLVQSQPEALPPGYRTVITDAADYELFDPDGEIVECGLLRNLVEARAAAEAHAAVMLGGPPVLPAMDDPGAVEIPANWQELPWGALRSLASKLDSTATTKDACLAAVQAELDRRAAVAAVGPGEA